MERPIGNIFEYEGITIEVVEDAYDICNGCFFDNNSCLSVAETRGDCCKRRDGKVVLFKDRGLLFKFLKTE